MGSSPGWGPKEHLHRETGTTLTTTAAQNGATVAGPLPHEEAVLPLTLDL